MAQKRIWDYHAPEDTELLNSRFKGIIRVGVHSGYEVKNGTAGFVTIRQGVLVTADGVRIEETTNLTDHLAIPGNGSGQPRLDYIVCRHTYIKTVPPPAALYQVIAGTPAASPEPPVVPSDAVILARGLLPSGATVYSEIRLATPDEVFNATFDGHDWRIIFGDKAAYRIERDINDGAIRFFIIPAGQYADGAVFSWPTPVMTLTDSGLQELLQEVSDRQAADSTLQSNINTEASTRSAADTTLQSNINSEASTRSSEDTAIKNALADAKGRAWNATVPANQDMAEMATRIGTLEGSSGVPAHRSRHENGGDDVVRFDQLADGTTYVKMLASERTKLAGISGSGDLGLKADKVSGAVNGNFAGLDSNGNLTDSGHKHSDYALIDHTHASAFPSGTRMVFYQDAAPTGWTKLTSGGALQDGAMMVFTTGNIDAAPQGSANPVNWSASHSHTVNSHSHSIPSQATVDFDIASVHNNVLDTQGEKIIVQNGEGILRVWSSGSASGKSFRNRIGTHNHGGTSGSAAPATNAGGPTFTPKFMKFIIAQKD